jgi:hypothetical protein
MTPETNHGNRRQFWRRLLLALGVQVFGLICIGAAIELRRATQSEVNSGSRVNAYVAPYELSQWTGAGGGPTNGQTGPQVQTAITSADGSGTNLMKPSSLVLGKITVSTNASTGMITWSNTTDHIALATLTTNGVLTVNGAGITNITGANFQAGTVNSNSFDAATVAMFGTGGGSGISQAQFTAGLGTGTNDATFNTVSTTNTGGRLSTMATGAIDNTHGALIEAHTASTNGAAANSEIAANYFVGAYLGNLAEATNLLHGNTVSGTASQITMTLSKNADGSTNFQAALANPLVISQANIGTLWGTNVLSPTNAFGGTVVDFNVGDSQTNLAGNLTFTGVANVTAGAVNTCIIRLLSGGADRTIAFPASWHLSRGSTSVVTNAYESDFLFTVVPGQRTNVAQLDYP